MQQHIAIETAKFCDVHGFHYDTFSRFPSTPKGLALAVVASDRMMSIDAYQQAHSDINVMFYVNEFDDGEKLDDDKLFELIGRRNAGFSIITDCRRVFEDRQLRREAKIQRVIRAAVEDLIAAGFALTIDDADGCSESEPFREVEAVMDQLGPNLFNGVDCHVTAYRDDLRPAVFTVEDDGSDNPIGSNMIEISPFLKRAHQIASAA
ncbi:hypothetical protein [Rhizobium ruizarguesonis]|uniref:hypothetical protein n=1 Tax=Rhizobium ruizarguesonis TaxID=2081791 RepID=UPI00102FC834|nr:hypothetical protein [Rhizobium ruizarguesonis]TAT69963.1 hypothetical protein ELI52_38705 [Rhizobium ruizarguesonis]